MQKPVVLAGTFFALFLLAAASTRGDDRIRESDDEIRLALPQIEGTIRKRGYVTGVAAQSLLDKKTGFRDAGFGLDIVDWIMEPGSDEAYRDKLKLLKKGLMDDLLTGRVRVGTA